MSLDLTGALGVRGTATEGQGSPVTGQRGPVPSPSPAILWEDITRHSSHTGAANGPRGLCPHMSPMLGLQPCTACLFPSAVARTGSAGTRVPLTGPKRQM